MKKILLLISIIAASLSLAAQDGITLHFMRLNPYSTYSSPSAFSQYTGHVGIPGISNINAAMTNSGIRYKILFESSQDGQIVSIKLGTLANQLSAKKNILSSSLSMNIIDFGFRVHKLRFDVSYRIRFDEFLTYNKDLINLPVKGNMYYVSIGEAARPELKLTLNAYQEFAVGIQAEITPQLYLGFRPKLLFGLAHAKTRNANATLYTNPEDYSLSINYNMDADISCIVPYSISKDTNGKTIFAFSPEDLAKNWQDAFKNVGAAIDLGFTYRINNMFGVSASVLDLGFIRWKTNNYRIHGETPQSGPHYNDGSFVFNGLSTDVLIGDEDAAQTIKDEILEYFPLNFDASKAYTSMISGRFLVEGYCNVGKYHRFSALFQGRIVNKQFIPSFTVAWNGNFLNIFDLCVSYTVAKKSFANLGLGIGFNLGVFHIYAATDNIFAFCNSKSIQRSILNAPNANIQAGIVFDWGKIQESKIENFKKVNFQKKKNSKPKLEEEISFE